MTFRLSLSLKGDSYKKQDVSFYAMKVCRLALCVQEEHWNHHQICSPILWPQSLHNLSSKKVAISYIQISCKCSQTCCWDILQSNPSKWIVRQSWVQKSAVLPDIPPARGSLHQGPPTICELSWHLSAAFQQPAKRLAMSNASDIHSNHKLTYLRLDYLFLRLIACLH